MIFKNFMLASIDCKLNKCPKNGVKVFKTIDLKRTACDFASKISQRQNPRAKKHRGHVRQGLRGG
ncbi:hypothetical protein T11_14268 [Trichinella zimbabwensis]|uniref:Uncharacterized protein n=1 Tax=Trichinella zimbabwensis TaxID=268475 RepID=A0A0V1H1R4_9BILA|nr:hypothetical protein T11_14268 [Trichinella zimbabwensis]